VSIVTDDRAPGVVAQPTRPPDRPSAPVSPPGGVSGPRASARLTTRILSAGSILSSLLFVASLVLAAARGSEGSTRVLAVDAVVAGLPALDPVAWASAAILVLLATPVVGLVATVAEFRAVERRFSLVAGLVLCVIAVSFVIALPR
jgi:uncharacterized membrane protein